MSKLVQISFAKMSKLVQISFAKLVAARNWRPQEMKATDFACVGGMISGNPGGGGGKADDFRSPEGKNISGISSGPPS